MKSFGTHVVALLVTPTPSTVLLTVTLQALGYAAGFTGLAAQETGTVEFVDDGAAPTFRAEPQPVTIREAMGAVLATSESFRLLTDLTGSRLAGCESTRPDLPDARIDPAEIADRVGSLNLAVFEDGQANFTFRTTTGGTEYAITMNASESEAVQVTRADSGELILSATAAPLSVTRDKAETFSCVEAADFAIRLTP